MNNKVKYLAAFVLIILIAMIVAACKIESADMKIINIVRHPEPADFTLISSSNKFPEEKDENFGFDVRSTNLSSEDLTSHLDDLLYTTYDSKTIWPEKLPVEFNPAELMELYKNPGLNIRELHKHGITGKGVGIAIIDQTLLVDHVDYKDRIKLYEENEESGKKDTAEMHGPAVASIAVGKTVGVAPEADLYYIAGDLGTVINNNFEYDFSLLAKNIDRILEVNNDLPVANKIRVISISRGWNKDQKGYEEINEAVNRAKEAGIFVVSSSLEKTFGYRFQGLGKYPKSDADNLESYKPGSWWQDDAEGVLGYYAVSVPCLFVPMDFRCTAAPNGVNDYVVYCDGGWSWTIPYIAGVYALSCQVKPDITYDEFWNIALETGNSVNIQLKGHEYAMKKIINPVGIIDRIK